ncbi:DUF3718 domain-containing protein [Pseudoalteromonas sp. C2R02]|uniref:DUF3718 domain-containing protein n=1 Tax=Pseudoalteromonas sp. C2R02 TaxID=2841565 RepID=UPI001C0A4C4B|nr:DUF3718 domain-containing protein [Pseudoalteromonas sp. C2R02]MBU2971512.1 DUF3718 domain-containing protein [Pseudoalteromonas sp. C2R02]
MKKYSLALTLMTVLGASISFAHAEAPMTDYMKTALTETCIAVKSNSILKLSEELREYNLKIATIRDKLMCNGESVHQFALTHNATKTANKINKGSVSIKEIASLPQEKYWVWIN